MLSGSNFQSSRHSRSPLRVIVFLRQVSVLTKSPNCDAECLPQDFSAIFRESLWIDPDKSLRIFTPPACLFPFTAVNTIIPSRDLFKRCMPRAIGIQGVHKKLLHWCIWERRLCFFGARVGGGSEASCLSSFNWFSVAIGAGLLFLFFSHESAALQSALFGFSSARRCQGSCPGFLHLPFAPIRWLVAHFGETFSAECLYHCRSVHGCIAMRV